MAAADVVTCALCRAERPEPGPLWTLSVERGHKRYYCERCSRENLRAIEGGLDPHWW